MTVKSSYEQLLIEGEPIGDELTKHESKIFSFIVPNDPTIHSISISIGLGTTNTSLVRMFATNTKNNNSLPSVQNTIKVMPTFLGLVGRVYKDESLFCVGCSYLILVSSKIRTSYSINYLTNRMVTKIKGSRLEVYELHRPQERNCYEFNVRDPLDTLEVYLSPYSGDPNIYVNQLTLPEDINSYSIFSKGFRDEVLSITPESRQKLNAVTGNYYICIFGDTFSTYNLMIYSERQDQRAVIPIYSGLTRTMHVNNDEFIVFKYIVKKKEKANITFTLGSLTGNADLYIKPCKENIISNSIGCTLFKHNMNDPDVKKSTLISSIDSIATSFDPKTCSGINEQCGFLIGVYGTSESHFSLTVFDDYLNEIPLAQGVPAIGFVELRKFSYYSFLIEDPSTTSVKIQLTSLSGDSDLYVSRINPNCGCLLHERYSSMDMFLPDSISFVKEKDGFLNASYHVSVFGFTQSSYTIVYTSTSKSENNTGIRLFDGRPQSGSINTMNPSVDSVLYRFEIYNAINNSHNIQISLTPLSGLYDVYASFNSTPTPSNYNWHIGPNENSLYISPNEVKRGSYFILVKMHNREEGIRYAFSIKYSTGAFMTILAEGMPEIGNLTRNTSAFYKFNVVNSTGSVIVTVTPFSGDPDLFISINSSNQFPSLRNSDYASASVGADSIKLSLPEVIQRNPQCNVFGFHVLRCAIYIGVICASQECAYSLQVSSPESSILKLVDGVPQHATSSSDFPQYFEFNPSTRNSSTLVSVQYRKGKVKLYANQIGYRLYFAEPQLPSPSKHNFSSQELASSEVLRISESIVQSCGFLCKYYFSVYTLPNETNPNQIVNSSFTIIATSNIALLIDGQSSIDAVTEKTYKYYTFRVPCDDCTLSISLTPLSGGDPDLYVDKGRYRLPNQNNADFRAAQYRGDFLQINSDHDYFIKSGETIRGDYTIGVFGFQNCTYTIMATTSASKLQELTQGSPVKQEQAQSTIKYFVFYSWKQESIKISLLMHSGRATIRANVIESVRESNILEKLPSKEDNCQWSSMVSSTLNYLMIYKSDPKFIQNGAYFIAVEAEEASSYDISIAYTSNVDFTFLKIGETYREHIGARMDARFAFVISIHSDIIVHINTFYGSVEAKVTLEPNGKTVWNVIPNLDTLIEKTDENFKEGTYYLTIHGFQESEVSIQIEQNMNTALLSEGQPQKAELNQGAPTFFYFELPSQKLAATKSQLSIFVKFDSYVVSPAIYIRHATRYDASMPSHENYDYNITWDNELKQLGGTVLLHPNQSPNLAIAVVGNFSGTSKIKRTHFEIVIYTTGITYLSPDNRHFHEFEDPNEMRIYEMSLQQVNRLYIEVVPCVGEVEFFVSKKLAGISDRRYDLKKSELSKGRLFGYVENPQGTYYIAVRGVSIGKLGNSSKIAYTIRTIVSNEQEISNLDEYYLEDNGNIYSYLDGDQFKLQWGKLYKRVGLNKISCKVRYSVYWSEINGANMQTVCGIKFGNAEKLGNYINQTSFTFHVTREMRNKKIAFNVIAEIEDLFDQTVAYNPLFIQLPNQRRPFRFFFGKKYFFDYILVILIVLIIVLAGLAFYYWKKYRKTEKKLEYEMSDARNLAQISTSQDIPPEKAEAYSGLKSQTSD